MEETTQESKWKKLLHDLKPRTRREWFKFGLDIATMCIFIYMCYINGYSYAQGWHDGHASSCFVNNTINWSFNLT